MKNPLRLHSASTDTQECWEEMRSSHTEPAAHISWIMSVTFMNSLPWDFACNRVVYLFQAIYNAQPDPSKDSWWRKSGFWCKRGSKGNKGTIGCPSGCCDIWDQEDILLQINEEKWWTSCLCRIYIVKGWRRTWWSSRPWSRFTLRAGKRKKRSWFNWKSELLDFIAKVAQIQAEFVKHLHQDVLTRGLLCRKIAGLSEQSSKGSAARGRKSGRSVWRCERVQAATQNASAESTQSKKNGLYLLKSRMRELVRKRRKPRGEPKMMPRKRRPSPASILEGTCRSWWAHWAPWCIFIEVSRRWVLIPSTCL